MWFLKFIPWLLKLFSYLGLGFLMTSRMKAKAGLQDADTALDIKNRVNKAEKRHETVADLTDTELDDALTKLRRDSED